MVGLLKTALLQAKTHIQKVDQFKNVMVVLGNETCDLDSAVSSLVYGLYLFHRMTPDTLVVPVMNIPRIQLPVKTEVIYVFNKYNLGLENIICRDELDLTYLQKAGTLKLALVDHHVLQPGDSHLANCVVSVIDHRPQDPAWPWTETELSLSIVGSCCSLVASKLLTQAPDLITPTIAVILLGTILLDTANLSPAANRATPFDHQVVEQLTSKCIPTYSVQYHQIFTELQSAKSDVSALTSAQLLIKDMKIASKIPIIGLPMKVENFLQRQDAIEAVHSFCEEINFDLCIIYGMDSKDDILTRDLAVYSMGKTEKRDKLISALKESKDPFLNLQFKPCSLPGVQLFEQTNIKHSRKQILPIVRKIGEKLN